MLGERSLGTWELKSAQSHIGFDKEHFVVVQDKQNQL
jgi:hypothetical protein